MQHSQHDTKSSKRAGPASLRKRAEDLRALPAPQKRKAEGKEGDRCAPAVARRGHQTPRPCHRRQPPPTYPTCHRQRRANGTAKPEEKAGGRRGAGGASPSRSPGAPLPPAPAAGRAGTSAAVAPGLPGAAAGRPPARAPRAGSGAARAPPAATPGRATTPAGRPSMAGRLSCSSLTPGAPLPPLEPALPSGPLPSPAPRGAGGGGERRYRGLRRRPRRRARSYARPAQAPAAQCRRPEVTPLPDLLGEAGRGDASWRHRK